MTKLHELGVAEAAKAIRAGDIKAEALADVLLARAAAHKSLNAFIALEPDKVRAAILAVDGYQGAEGIYKFDKNGDGLHGYNIVKNNNGTIVFDKHIDFNE